MAICSRKLLTNLLKMLSFFYFVPFASLSKISWAYFLVFLSLFYSIDLCVYLLLISCSLNYDRYLKSNKLISTTLFFIFRIVSSILGPMSFHIHFNINLSICTQKTLLKFW